jgi:serine/threonine-protein kinase
MPKPETIVNEGDFVAGKYRVEKILGAGGMGCVVSALHVELRQRVALKFLLPKFAEDAQIVERFEREARAVVRLRSEHVVRVFDVGRIDSGIPYIVMEQLEGSNLATLVTSRGPLPGDEVIEYILQVCDGLGEAHANHIIHRDLKPQNLFLTRRYDGRPLVKILDFGVSKITQSDEQQITQTHDALGTPAYMAPEQLLGARNVDERSDVWALGIIMFKLLTGQLPFEGHTMTETCLRITSDPTPPLSSYRVDVPRELAAIVDRCLEKVPSGRFASVSDLAASLRQIGRVIKPSPLTADTLAAPAPLPSGPLSAAEGRTNTAWEDAAPRSAPRGSRSRALLALGISSVLVATGAFATARLLRSRSTHRAEASTEVLAAAQAPPIESSAPTLPSAVAAPPDPSLPKTAVPSSSVVVTHVAPPASRTSAPPRRVVPRADLPLERK